MSGQTAKENRLLPGAATWTSRSGVVLDYDSLSMLTATRKARGRVSPLAEQNCSNIESNSPMKMRASNVLNRGNTSFSPSKKLSDLNIPKTDFLRAVNFESLANRVDDDDMDEADSCEEEEEEVPSYGYQVHPRVFRVGPNGDDRRSPFVSPAKADVHDVSACSDLTDQQKAKEQTKLLEKFKQMRQAQLQQQEKLIQQQQQQLDALRQEQQRVHSMIAKQRDVQSVRKGRSPGGNTSTASPYASPSRPVQTSSVLQPLPQMIQQVAGAEDSEPEEDYTEEESDGHDSNKENIPIVGLPHVGLQDELEEDFTEDDFESVEVEGVVPFTDTASACSEIDDDPQPLFSSYEVETMVQMYAKKPQRRAPKMVAAPVEELEDSEDEPEYENDEEIGRESRTPTPEPIGMEDLGSGNLDDKPVVGGGKTFEQLLAEQLQLEQRKDQLGIGYTPSPKAARKKTFLRKGQGIARFTGPPAKPVHPKKTAKKLSLHPGLSTNTATNNGATSKVANNTAITKSNNTAPSSKSASNAASNTMRKKDDGFKVPLKTLLLKPLEKPGSKKFPPVVQGKRTPGQMGNTSMDASFMKRVKRIETTEKEELDELEEFELLEQVADNYSFTSSTSSSQAAKPKASDADTSDRMTRYKELMKKLADESSSEYSSSSDESDDEENQDKTLTDQKNASLVSSEVSTPRKMQRKIASKEAGMAVTEREVMSSDFREPESSEHSESDEEEEDEEEQDTLIHRDDVGYRLGQQDTSAEKPSQGHEFDDEDSWGTPHRADLDRDAFTVKPLVTSKPPIAYDKADHVQVEKVKVAEEEVSSASPPPVSKLMTKLFPKLKPPKPKPTVEEQQNQAKLQAARQPDVAEGAVSKALRDKLLEIDREIERFRTENAAVAKIKAEREEGLKKLKKEMEEFDKQKNEELKNLQEFKEQEMKKLKKEKKLFEKYRKEAQAIPDKKQREEIEHLKDEINDLRDELRKREQRWTSGSNRMRNRVEQLEKENTELREEIRMLEKLRLESWQKEQNTKNEQKSQLPIRKPAIVQQVLPSTKNQNKPTQNGGDARKGHDKKRSQPATRRSDPLRLSIQSDDEDVFQADDDSSSPLNSTVIERVQSPVGEDKPRGQVAMATQSEVDRSFMSDPTKPRIPRKTQVLVNAITKIDKGDLEYEETRHKDGKVDRMYSNGAREIVYANGTRREISSDGQTIIVSFFNGDLKQIMPDHRVIYFYADAGTTHTTYPDGLEILQFPNLQIEKHYPDGTREITFPDQIIKYLFPNGGEESIFPDGTVIRVDKNGDRTVEFANGQREVHTQQFKKREYPDGTTKTVYPDGRQETRYSTGRVRVKDKDGNILVDQRC